jgi:hypothetical protein
MDGYDLWTEASREPEAERAELRHAMASAYLEPLAPFLLAARTRPEHEHRLAIAAERIEAIAATSELAPGVVEDIARRHFALMLEARQFTAADEEDEGQVIIVDKRTGAKVAGPMSAEAAHEQLESADFGVPREELGIEKVQEGDDRAEGDEEGEGGEKEASLRRRALQEGENPLGWLMGFDGGQGGPERPDGHGTQFSEDGSYSEIPTGQLRGPDPAVTGWIDPQRDNNGSNDQGQVEPDEHLARRRRTAAGERSGNSLGQGGATAAPRQSPERSGRGPQQNAGGQQAPVQGGQSEQGHYQRGGGEMAPPQQGGQVPPGTAGDPTQNPMARQVPLTTRPHQGPGGGPAAPPAPEPTSVVGIPVPMPAQPGAPQGDPTAGQQSQPGAESQTITAAAALISRYNPGLPPRECRRIGAKMAARYYTAVSSVYDDDPSGDQGTGSGGSHFIPRPGGSGGDEAGSAAEEAAEVLPELAL